MTISFPRQIFPIALSGLLASQGLQAAPMPDFALEDVNATSPRFGESISPRDYLRQVSVYYFGQST